MVLGDYCYSRLPAIFKIFSMGFRGMRGTRIRETFRSIMYAIVPTNRTEWCAVAREFTKASPEPGMIPEPDTPDLRINLRSREHLEGKMSQLFSVRIHTNRKTGNPMQTGCGYLRGMVGHKRRSGFSSILTETRRCRQFRSALCEYVQQIMTVRAGNCSDERLTDPGRCIERRRM